ncbi:hypothetical protein FP435_00400 (plasmid) [Lactobacillus sp. PV037]|uniref:MucBP domain-containing protein n=1 Tax=Lactobacillus sp. PV037 TaxID=2594496 RepID=UPI002240B0E6|nr:MucBP domain-containing protein [Lactobacillus sp. PV037]QNQ82997.1 hypothetical protein FP435_00400 [Lactobacillus sp. PV037]
MSLFGFSKKKESNKTKDLVESKPTIFKNDKDNEVAHDKKILINKAKNSHEEPDTSGEVKKVASESKLTKNKLLDQKEKTDIKDTKSFETALKKNAEESKKVASTPTVTPKISKPIIVHFLADNKKIMHDITLSGNIGEKITQDSLPKIKGYELVDKFNHKISEKEQEINVHYKQIIRKYHIIPVSEDLHPINTKNKIEDESFEGMPGSKIKSDIFPKIEGYYLFRNRHYYVPESDEAIVKVVYGASKHNVTIRYKTTSGTLLREKPLSGVTGEDYTLPAQKFEGYALTTPEKLTGKFSPNQDNIELTYKPISCHITVDFIDKSGNTLHKPLILKGDYKTKFSINVPTIEGYELSSDSNLLQGTFLKEKGNVALRFKKISVSFKINFWFDNHHTKAAAKPITISGIYQDIYFKEIPPISGYIPSQTEVSGTFNVKNPDIDVVYEKQDCQLVVLLEDQTGRLLNIPNNKLILKGKWNESYKQELPKIDGYNTPSGTIEGNFTNQNETIEIHYTPLKTTLTINYIDANTQKPIKEIKPLIEEVLFGSSYAYDPISIEGYQIQNIPHNAAGVVKDKTTINFEYKPYSAKIFVHYYDSTMTTIRKDDIISGVHAESYNYTPKEIPGYKYVESSDSLKGTFNAGRKDIDLIFNPTYISFSLIPINQFGKSLKEYRQTINGLVNQDFSAKMPSIPGFTLDSTIFNGKIKSYYQGKTFKIAYKPTTQSITIHSQVSGGVNDHQIPFPDEKISGTTDSKYSFTLPTLPGHHTKSKMLTGAFKANDEDITITYYVNSEDYQIHFLDENEKIVGGLPQKHGHYGDAIDISTSIPEGYHLPEGEEDIKVILNGQNLYQIPVIANSALVELVPQTENGINLDAQIQLLGKFHESKTISVPSVPGFEPVNGEKITINFNSDNQVIPIIYQPQSRQVTIRYISLQGQNILSPKVISGKYQETYQINAEQIPGYVPVDATTQSGVFGLEKNIETTFIYRSDSDNYNPSVTNLEDYLSENENVVSQSQGNRHGEDTNSNSQSSEPTTNADETTALDSSPRNLLEDIL